MGQKQTELLLNFTRVDAAVPAPLRATKDAAGFDCSAAGREFLTYRDGELVAIDPSDAKQFDIVRYSTGIQFEIPVGHVGLAFARSSIIKMPLIMANTTGVIDADFRGELAFLFRILDPQDIEKTSYQIGDRVGQLVIVKMPELALIEAAQLSDTPRGAGAYGSTGR